MREIILDTETTGLDPASGHRLVEVACIEIEDFVPTGKTFHTYLDPQRDVPEDAFRVHGLSREFLKGKPLFAQIYGELLEFIGASRLVIHNAEFDMKFLNAELRQAGASPIPMAQSFDTLALARKKFPGGPNSLDGLCARYRIDNSRRTKHGALLDSEILAEVYMELMGGRQAAFALEASRVVREKAVAHATPIARDPIYSPICETEVRAHEQLRATLGDKSVWRRYVAL